MRAVNDLSAEYVRSILHYNPVTGIFSWRVSLSNRCIAGSIAGSSRNNGRRQISIEGRDYLSARLAWLYMTGDWPPFDIDHRDRNKGNDRWKNLRPATRSQNHFNRSAYRNNTSGFKGVSCDRARQQFAADIRANGKRIRLGRFPTAEEAAAAYQNAATREHGEFACFDGRN